MINRQRFAERFEAMAAIGRTKNGGVHRPALTDEDRACRDLLGTWCRQAGLTLAVDKMGSMFATLEGSAPGAPPLLIGSHLDSQPFAGAYDGPLGVLAALETIETMIDLGVVPSIPVQLVNWTNEEGARFRPPLVASAVFAETMTLEEGLASRDVSGCRLGDELVRIGYAGTERPGWPVHGYIELHIEQGTVLERADAPIGIVTGGVGLTDLTVTVRGQDTHAGPLEMAERRDALVGAAQMIVEANRIGFDEGADARVTVGRIRVPSDSHSVVPGVAEFTLDLRHPELEGLRRLEERARAAFATIATERGLELGFERLWRYPPFGFDAALRSTISTAADDLGYRTLSLPSRAGHDAWNMAKIAPAAMIFIPCRDGISHNESEFASPEHMIAGTAVLANVVRSIVSRH